MPLCNAICICRACHQLSVHLHEVFGHAVSSCLYTRNRQATCFAMPSVSCTCLRLMVHDCLVELANTLKDTLKDVYARRFVDEAKAEV